jgi:hypothetical protein
MSGPILGMGLPGDNRIEIRLRRKVSSKTFHDKIKKIFELAEVSLVDGESCSRRRSSGDPTGSDNGNA